MHLLYRPWTGSIKPSLQHLQFCCFGLSLGVLFSLYFYIYYRWFSGSHQTIVLSVQTYKSNVMEWMLFLCIRLLKSMWTTFSVAITLFISNISTSYIPTQSYWRNNDTSFIVDLYPISGFHQVSSRNGTNSLYVIIFLSWITTHIDGLVLFFGTSDDFR